MSSLSRSSIVSLAIGVVLWLAPPSLFLSAYIGWYGAPTSAIVPHLGIIAFFAAASGCVRCLLRRWTILPVATVAGSLLTGAILFVLVAYYLASIAGLNSWGRLITLPLITTYLGQANSLVVAAGYSFYLLSGAIFLTYSAISIALYLVMRRWDWTREFAGYGSSRLSVAVSLLVAFVLCLSAWRFAEFPPASAGEPFSLTLHPSYGAHARQLHDKVQSNPLDLKEFSAKASYRPAPLSDFPNVILVVVDALRSDHLSVNGYGRETTPFLSRLVREGRLQNIHPLHGVCAESACGLRALATARNVHETPGRPLTLQEVLRLHGYGIHMLLGGDHTHFYGLRDTYGKVDTYFDGSMSGGSYMNDDNIIVNRLASFPAFSGNPSFIQIHLMSTHALGTRDPATSPFQPSKSYIGEIVKSVSRSVDPADKQAYINYYDNGIIRTDRMMEEIIQTLGGKGYLQKALVIVTADHGEFLGDHDFFGHVKSVHEQALNIPLMLLRYGYTPDSRWSPRATASQIDIAPTILAEFGMPIPSSWTGIPLQGRAAASGPGHYLYFQQKSEFGLIEGDESGLRWKFWIDQKSGKEYAFDLAADPSETINRAAELAPATKARWRHQLIDIEVNVKESANEGDKSAL